LPSRQGRAPHSRLLDPEVEALICAVLDQIYLQPERPRVSDLLRAVETEAPSEVARRIGTHADSRTTKLYDRRAHNVLVEDMERIRY